jgi:hypothetical protein
MAASLASPVPDRNRRFPVGHRAKLVLFQAIDALDWFESMALQTELSFRRLASADFSGGST